MLKGLLACAVAGGALLAVTTAASAADPYTFALTVALSGQNGEAPSAAFIDDIITDVTRACGARDQFTFTVAFSAAAQLGLFAAARVATYARLELQATA